MYMLLVQSKSAVSFPTDSLCQGLTFELKETNVTAKEGECVQINCIGSGIRSYPYFNATWLWFKNAKFSEALQNFEGTIVYSNDDERKAHQEFEGRVIGSQLYPSGRGLPSDQREWNLKICCLRMNDSGNYSFRYEGSNGRFMTNPEVKLQVHGKWK